MMKKISLWAFGILVFLLVIAIFCLRTPDTSADAMTEKYTSNVSQFLELPSGDRIHYRDTGNSDGKVFILLHGANSSLHTWELSTAE